MALHARARRHCRARRVSSAGMPPVARTPWIVAALLPTLLLAACVTGPAPAPSPIVPMPEGAVFTQLAVQKGHACGLRADGSAVCWGRNNEGQLDVPEGLRFRQLTVGRDFSCGLLPGGALACWGRESADWLGGESGTWATAAAGRHHLCALDADGAVACWGAIGPPPEGSRYTAIGAGRRYGCGLTFTGDLECWGDNVYGQAEWREGPFTALGVGSTHSCVLRPDGSAFCQGLGYHSKTQPPDASFTSITAGRGHSCGLTAAREPVCWGREGDPPAGPFTALSSGWDRACGLRPGGEAVCWGMTGESPALNLNVAPAPAFEGREFNQPVELFPWPGGGLAVAERRGAITVHVPGAPPRLILDLTPRTAFSGERGLLGVALDPEFEPFPFLYVYYSTFDAGEATGRVSRFPVVDGRADAESELVILELRQPGWIHLGGAVRFGPDGMLYLGFGDAQRPRDAQDPRNLSGAIIRIDTRGATADAPYRIPDDNPPLATPDARPELWAWGLRNPWRMSFDAAGRLWVADVGDKLEEEVSLVTAGANLGWPLFEGERCHAEERACDALGATPPVVSYDHDAGCAVMGGVPAPSNGAYLFGDYCSGRIWIVEEGGETGWSMREIARAGHQILSFGRGPDDEVYVLTQGGPILRIEPPP